MASDPATRRAYLQECRDFTAGTGSPYYPGSLWWFSLAAAAQGDLGEAEAAYIECRDLWERAGLERGKYNSYQLLGTIERAKGNLSEADAAYTAGLDLARASQNVYREQEFLAALSEIAALQGDYTSAYSYDRMRIDASAKTGPAAASMPFTRMAVWARMLNRFEDARACLARALETARDDGDSARVAQCQQLLSCVEVDAGNPAAARNGVRSAMQHVSVEGDTQTVVALVEEYGQIASDEGRRVDAVRLLSAAESYRAQGGTPYLGSPAIHAIQAARAEELVAALRGSLGDSDWNEAWDRGAKMSIAQAADVLREHLAR
jgi:tetratricopeptide (TPR) repeat protein